MSAYELFAGCGVTRRLYDAFLSPMLLVTLFAPPTQLSAAAALGACRARARGGPLACERCLTSSAHAQRALFAGAVRDLPPPATVRPPLSHHTTTTTTTTTHTHSDTRRCAALLCALAAGCV
jgi:hypothetical protein